ncbi:MAG: hypothetical protein JKX72_05845 [Robiginitomaculum sp.]|nr:hypothetical protein [Robiginitomaculum sp.]
MTRTITNPAYRYGFRVTAIYDGDTIVGNLDMYDHVWKADETIRLYGINCQEIKRSKRKGITTKDVQIGFDHRDSLIRFLGLDPDNFPRKVKYHTLEVPVWVVMETVQDKSGKFGRLLGIVHKNGKNLNEYMRDIIGGVEFYDSKIHPADTPIIPPQYISNEGE